MAKDPAFSEETLARLKEILPPHRLKAHAESLDADVARLAAATTLDPMDSIRGTAHKIVSQAGMLGLLQLSARAAEVEQACWDEERLCGALERFREAAADPRATLGELIGQP